VDEQCGCGRQGADTGLSKHDFLRFYFTLLADKLSREKIEIQTQTKTIFTPKNQMVFKIHNSSQTD
jgi:hypothetical protein